MNAHDRRPAPPASPERPARARTLRCRFLTRVPWSAFQAASPESGLEGPDSEPGSRKWEWLLALVTVAAFGLTWWGYYSIPAAPLGLAQPLPFSHRVHVGVKKLSCLMCHNTVQAEAHAGIPPVETCMLCHSRIIITYPDIQQLRFHYYEGVPLLWNRVNILPDYVKFNHSQHINHSVDCGHCHGDVRAMDRIKPPQEFLMGFCMNCHKTYNATHDCFTCHR